MTTTAIAKMPDSELLREIARAAAADRQLTAELIALLAEFDARRLHLSEGCGSLFAYCTQVLRFSEHAAYHRIETARAARYFPIILDLIADGSITTTTVALLRPHLTSENHGALLRAARHKSKREVEYQIACLAPKPDVESLVRRLPVATPPAPSDGPPCLTEPVERSANASAASSSVGAVHPTVAPPPAPKLEALSRDRYLLRITLSAEAQADLRRAQDLMAHTVPTGDPATVIGRALSLLVAHLERQRVAGSVRPQRGASKRALAGDSRYIPAAVRREVWTRDGGRCAFIGSRGRCTQTRRLEFHHIVPFARCGPPTVENIALRCRAHNQFEGERDFGRSLAGV